MTQYKPIMTAWQSDKFQFKRCGTAVTGLLVLTLYQGEDCGRFSPFPFQRSIYVSKARVSVLQQTNLHVAVNVSLAIAKDKKKHACISKAADCGALLCG